jgi:type IV secretion system protein VirB11
MESKRLIAPEILLKHKTLVTSLGSNFIDLLQDPNTIEIMLNPNTTLWWETLDGDMLHIGEIKPHVAKSIIHAVADFNNTIILAEKPTLEASFPLDKSRFTAIIPPNVENPIFTLRKRGSRVSLLEEYVESGAMNQLQYRFICKLLQRRINLLVVGGTGTGKTTLVNGLIKKTAEIYPNDRLVIIEDTPELQCEAPNNTPMLTFMDMSAAVRLALRLRPDRILLGEVRGAPALDLMTAWNTGHKGGIGTLHANDAPSAISRLVTMISQNKYAPTDIKELIYSAMPAIIHVAKKYGDDDYDEQKPVTINDLDTEAPPSGKRYVKDIIQLTHYEELTRKFTAIRMDGSEFLI